MPEVFVLAIPTLGAILLGILFAVFDADDMVDAFEIICVFTAIANFALWGVLVFAWSLDVAFFDALHASWAVEWVGAFLYELALT